MNITKKRMVLKIGSAAAACALVPTLLASPAAANDVSTIDRHQARIHHMQGHHRHNYARAYDVRDSYAQAPDGQAYDEQAYDQPAFAGPEFGPPLGYSYSVFGYHCGIGLSNSPLACEPGD